MKRREKKLKPRGRPFAKGQPRSPDAGRKKGTPNKATLEVREFARNLIERPKYVKGLKERLDAGKAPHMEALLFQYAYGKPKEILEPGDVIARAIIDEAAAELRAKLAALDAATGAGAVSGKP